MDIFFFDAHVGFRAVFFSTQRDRTVPSSHPKRINKVTFLKFWPHFENILLLLQRQQIASPPPPVVMSGLLLCVVEEPQNFFFCYSRKLGNHLDQRCSCGCADGSALVRGHHARVTRSKRQQRQRRYPVQELHHRERATVLGVDIPCRSCTTESGPPFWESISRAGAAPPRAGHRSWSRYPVQELHHRERATVLGVDIPCRSCTTESGPEKTT